MAIFPLTPDQTIAQMWSNGVRGGQTITAIDTVNNSHNGQWTPAVSNMNKVPPNVTIIITTTGLTFSKILRKISHLRKIIGNYRAKHKSLI